MVWNHGHVVVDGGECDYHDDKYGRNGDVVDDDGDDHGDVDVFGDGNGDAAGEGDDMYNMVMMCGKR